MTVLADFAEFAELDPDSFPIDCIETDADCVALASKDVVCLRGSEEPLGGEKIWPDYSVWAGRNTTTPAPSPTPPMPPSPSPKPTPNSREETFFKVYSIVLTALVGVAGLIQVSRIVHRRFWGGSYEPLPSPSVGEMSPDSPYNSQLSQNI